MDNPNNRLITKSEVENILNYFENIGENNTFLEINNLEHYREAFIHESYYQAVQHQMTSGETNSLENFYLPKSSSERLEYLGDSILKAIMGRYLFDRFGNEREGFLTRLKIKIEKCSMLHKIGIVLGFKKYILLSLQVENQTILDTTRGRGTPSFYEDAFEAFIGSILVDFGEKGYLYADRFVRSVIENIIDFAELISKNDNFKDSLQRYFQSLKFKPPVYTSLQEDGPLYRKIFTRMLIISGKQLSEMNEIIQNDIRIYHTTILEEYRLKNPTIFSKLFELCQNDNYILGIGFGRKVTSAEQECAKTCLENLHLDLNF
jgi:dsRNA-specific ribonuclease